MAGLWPQSRTQIVDPVTGKAVVGAKLYFYEGGTSTPLTVYTTPELTTPHTSPILSDSLGRWPRVYFTQIDGTTYREKVLKPSGTVLYDDDNIPVLWQPPAQPEEPTIDENALLKTGDIIASNSTGTRAGFLLCNGRTFGSATSGADYAAADNEALFLVLWARGDITVGGGKGASAAADWAAGKVMTTPDMRGRGPFGTDQMGAASAAGRLSGITSVGNSGGAQSVTLTIDTIPSHGHTGTTDSAGAHEHSGGFTQSATGSSGGTGFYIGVSANTASAGAHTHPFTTSNVGGGQAHENMPPYMAWTFYIKK